MEIGIETSFLVALAVKSHSKWQTADRLVSSIEERGMTFAIPDICFVELLHIVTDMRRFPAPLTMEEGLAYIDWWRDADEVRVLHSSTEATNKAYEWIKQHRLGRKRIMDTYIGGIFNRHSIRHILTLNWADFEVFGYFTQVTDENLNLI